MGKLAIFALGVIAGSAIVINELAHERILVNNNLDGSTTLHFAGILRSKTKPE